MAVVVQKYGGSSVGNVKKIKQVANSIIWFLIKYICYSVF